jgi:hypothetical protein
MIDLMRRRLTALLAVLALGVSAPAALAQDGGGAFGPLPQAPPAATPTPTPDPSIEAQQDTDRRLLYGIGGALIVLFVIIGRVITRDARRTLPDEGRSDPRLREEGPHRHARQTKAKARAKGKAQRRARRQNR